MNKTETCGTLNVGLETHDNQFQIYKGYSAWQRQLTPNAEAAARRALGLTE